jgi:hypothetical protein
MTAIPKRMAALPRHGKFRAAYYDFDLLDKAQAEQAEADELPGQMGTADC